MCDLRLLRNRRGEERDGHDEAESGGGECGGAAHEGEDQDGRQAGHGRRDQRPSQHRAEGRAGVRRGVLGAVGHLRSASSVVVAEALRDGL